MYLELIMCTSYIMQLQRDSQVLTLILLTIMPNCTTPWTLFSNCHDVGTGVCVALRCSSRYSTCTNVLLCVSPREQLERVCPNRGPNKTNRTVTLTSDFVCLSTLSSFTAVVTTGYFSMSHDSISGTIAVRDSHVDIIPK